MTLEQQVTSLEIAKRLKELGVKQKSLFYWYDGEIKKINRFHFFPSGKEIHFTDKSWTNGSMYWSAFTVAELGEMLPIRIKTYKKFVGGKKFVCEYKEKLKIYAETEANARGLMLIHLLENKLI